MHKPLLMMLLALASHGAYADYRAEAVQIAPNGQTMSAQIAATAEMTRSDFQRNGESVVQIFNQRNGQQTLLFPSRKTYMQSPEGEFAVLAVRTNPCEGIRGARCVEQGRETIDGRSAIKWQVSFTDSERNLTSTQWIDVERGLPLRIQGSHGEQSETRLSGKETLLGREVEKWEMSTHLPNGQTLTGRQWYDPELKTLLREELMDGSVRELKSLEITTLPAELFSVPVGFRRVEAAPTVPSSSR